MNNFEFHINYANDIKKAIGLAIPTLILFLINGCIIFFILQEAFDDDYLWLSFCFGIQCISFVNLWCVTRFLMKIKL